MELKDILANLGIAELNPMQQAALQSFAVDKNMVLLSPTGSGKTLAYLLPLVQSLEPSSVGVQAVVLVPSRELALQTEQVFKSMGTQLRVMSCYGGRPAMDEHRVMKSLNPHVIVATPGRMNDHLGKGNFSPYTVRTLVIDEFDKSLELGFQEEMSQVISHLPGVRKRVLLSATDAQEIPDFVGVSSDSGSARAQFIKLDYTGGVELESRLQVHLVNSPEKDKLETLYRLLCSFGSQSTLVFVNYRESVARVVGFLQAKRFPCDMFHGGMEQPDRERSLYKFCNGTVPVLVSTDLAARGLDVPGIENVVHYHLPVNQEAMVHRNGRTARWDAQGNAYMILGPEEHLPEYVPADMPVYELPENTGRPPRSEWCTLYIGRGKKDKLNKVDVLGFICKKGKLDKNDVGRIDVKDHYAFVAVRRSKLKQLLEQVSGEKIKGMRTLLEEAK